MRDRRDIEERERAVLAPWAMRSCDTRGRRHEEAEHHLRTAYQRDRDRVVHCKAFRRLEYKTQVFVNHEGDHFRTRLTHTLEVAQIARTIARILGANEDLAEAVALAHDLGHTAFGHSGEEALARVMEDHGGFEHNRHGLRIVELLEHPYPDFRGLNLTFEVRQSILKYPDADRPAEAELALDGATGERAASLIEAQIVDRADSIAYVHHDLDDGIAAGILDESSLAAEVELWAGAAEAVDRERSDLDPTLRRKLVIRRLIDSTVTDLVTRTEANLVEQGIGDVADVRGATVRLVEQSPELARQKAELSSYLHRTFYRSAQIQRMALKAARILEGIWRSYVSRPEMLPPHWQVWASEQGQHRAICDYVAGMTDRMAADDYAQLFLP